MELISTKMCPGRRKGIVCSAAFNAELAVTAENRISAAFARSEDEKTSGVPLSLARC